MADHIAPAGYPWPRCGDGISSRLRFPLDSVSTTPFAFTAQRLHIWEKVKASWEIEGGSIPAGYAKARRIGGMPSFRGVAILNASSNV
jgi:hypothetical protein